MGGLNGVTWGEQNEEGTPVQEEVEARVFAKASMLAEDELLRRVPDRRLRRPSTGENEETVRKALARSNGLAIEFERAQANIRL
tara:strand:- start:224 stop:475 length:252 start_codon:yes stop_codon:yes gene_type:complete